MSDRILPERVSQTHRAEPKRAKVIFDRLDLYRLLEVPEGIEITGVQVTQDPLTVQVLVTGDRLPVRPTPILAESPIVEIALVRQREGGEPPPDAARIVWLDGVGRPI